MGTNKPTLPFRNQSILGHILSGACNYFETIILIAGEHKYDTALRHIPDAISDAGPLSGLLSALRDTRNDSIALLPVDLPLVSEKTLARLASETVPADKMALLARHQQSIQPLIGVYSRTLAQPLNDYLESGERSVFRFVDTLSCGFFPVEDEELTNINTPGDYQTLIRKFS